MTAAETPPLNTDRAVKLRGRVRAALTRYAEGKPEEAVLCAAYAKALDAVPVDLYLCILGKHPAGAGTESQRVSLFPMVALWHWLSTDTDRALRVIGPAMYAEALRMKRPLTVWNVTTQAEVESSLCRFAHMHGVMHGESTGIYASPSDPERAAAAALLSKVEPYFRASEEAPEPVRRRKVLGTDDPVARLGFRGPRAVVNKAIFVRDAARVHVRSAAFQETPLREYALASLDACDDPRVFCRDGGIRAVLHATMGFALAKAPGLGGAALGRMAAVTFSEGLLPSIDRARCIAKIEEYVGGAIRQCLAARTPPGADAPDDLDALHATAYLSAKAAISGALSSWRVAPADGAPEAAQ